MTDQQKRSRLSGRDKHVTELANSVRRTLRDEVLRTCSSEDLGILLVRLGDNPRALCEEFIRSILDSGEEATS